MKLYIKNSWGEEIEVFDFIYDSLNQDGYDIDSEDYSYKQSKVTLCALSSLLAILIKKGVITEDEFRRMI